jgi:hypothetical protein
MKMETTMQKQLLAILGTLLISASLAQIAAASEHHHSNRSKAYFGRDISEYRGSYNQIGPITVAPQPIDRFDPSAPRNEGPLLNPAGN